MAIAFSVACCSNGTTGQGPGSFTSGGGSAPDGTTETSPAGTYAGTKNGTTYTLTVYPSTAKTVHAVGDKFTLTLKRDDIEKTCSGKLVEVTDTTLSAQPSYEDAEVFTITISGVRITKISTDTITFDDGSTEQGPGSFTSGGGGGGGGGGGTTTTPNTPTTPANVAVTGVTLAPATLNLTVGGSAGILTATVAPSNATNKTLTWDSSKTDVATVSEGTVTAVAQGTATITVTTVDGNHTATCTVNVSYVPTGSGTTTLTITFAQIADSSPSITGPTLYRASKGSPTSETLTLDNPGQYDSINWRVDNTTLTGTGSSFTLSASNTAYNLIGEHFVTVVVMKGGAPYNKTVSFRVEY